MIPLNSVNDVNLIHYWYSIMLVGLVL